MFQKRRNFQVAFVVCRLNRFVFVQFWQMSAGDNSDRLSKMSLNPNAFEFVPGRNVGAPTFVPGGAFTPAPTQAAPPPAPKPVEPEEDDWDNDEDEPEAEEKPEPQAEEEKPQEEPEQPKEEQKQAEPQPEPEVEDEEEEEVVEVFETIIIYFYTKICYLQLVKIQYFFLLHT